MTHKRKPRAEFIKHIFWWCLFTKVVPKAINLSPDNIAFGEHLSLLVFIKLFSCNLIFHFSFEASIDIGLVFTNPNPISRFFQVHSLKCNVHGCVHRSNILVYKSQQDAQVIEFILSENCSTCFGFHYHPSSGAQNNCNYSIW